MACPFDNMNLCLHLVIIDYRDNSNNKLCIFCYVTSSSKVKKNYLLDQFIYYLHISMSCCCTGNPEDILVTVCT